MPRRIAALLAVALLSAAACGGSSDEDPPAGADDGTDGPSALAVTVRASDFEFEPDTIEVDPGETVDLEFVNTGNVRHSLTIEEIDFDEDGATGETIAAAFTVPDEDTTLEFVCRFHPSQMTGKVVVGDGGSGAGGSGGSSGEDAESDPYDY
jgi:plastocyanin